MKPQSLIMLVVAAGCGLAAMVMTQRFLSVPSDRKSDDMVSVVVASVEIQPGNIVSDLMIKDVEYPKAFVPQNAITDRKTVVGRATRYHIVPEEVMTTAKLAEEGVKGGIEPVIPEGMRAVTIGIPTNRSVAGFIRADSHVDIMVNTRGNGTSRPPAIKTILQDVKVIAVNADMHSTDPDNKGKIVEMVTFLVTPDEAEILQLAAENGSLALRLRSSIDKESVTTKMKTIEEVLSGKQALDERPETTDPKALFLEKDKAIDKKKKKGLSGLLAMFSGPKKTEEAKKEAETEAVNPVTPTTPATPIVQVPRKVMKRLIYRDLEGKPLMEVMIDAESRMAGHLRDMLEDVELENPEGAGKAGIQPTTQVPQATQSVPVTEPKMPAPGQQDSDGEEGESESNPSE